MNAIVQFFMRMDSRAARAVGISVVLFALVLAIFLVGRFVFDLQPGALQTWFEEASHQWYALPATMLFFTLLAFVGVPQFALIAACVFAFGPVQGFVFSWLATLVSGTVDFYLGRFLGADVIRRYGGQTVNRISAFVGRNGFWASLIVRNVPSAPFIVVNMAAGVSHMGFLPFIAGLAIGSIPKGLLVAFAGGGMMALFAGASGWLIALSLVGVGASWLVAMLVARWWLRSSRFGEEAASLKSGPDERGDAES